MLLANAQVVLWEALQWQATNNTSVVSTMQQTSSWQYVYENGPASLFQGDEQSRVQPFKCHLDVDVQCLECLNCPTPTHIAHGLVACLAGYAWSLDTFVDYVWCVATPLGGLASLCCVWLPTTAAE